MRVGDVVQLYPMEERDWREGHEAGRQVDEEYIRKMCEKMPKKFELQHLDIRYERMDGEETDENEFDGWLKWVFDELVKEKGEDRLFRHKHIVLRGVQFVNYDMNVVPEIDDKKTVYDAGKLVSYTSRGRIYIDIYTAARRRNTPMGQQTRKDTYSRKLFSAGDGMWDEISWWL